jgi:hypothetical protein
LPLWRNRALQECCYKKRQQFYASGIAFEKVDPQN